jgi:hypothetical protein
MHAWCQAVRFALNENGGDDARWHGRLDQSFKPDMLTNPKAVLMIAFSQQAALSRRK